MKVLPRAGRTLDWPSAAACAPWSASVPAALAGSRPSPRSSRCESRSAVAGSRRAARVGGHREVKNGAPGQVGGHPQPAPMSFDDRTADRQPQSQPAGLRRMEGLEEALDSRRRQPRTGILHCDHYAIWFGLDGGDEQLSRPFRDRTHCLDSVDDEIEDNLLQLYAISFDERQTLPECHL